MRALTVINHLIRPLERAASSHAPRPEDKPP